jgi:hypothetical protein
MGGNTALATQSPRGTRSATQAKTCGSATNIGANTLTAELSTSWTCINGFVGAFNLPGIAGGRAAQNGPELFAQAPPEIF